MILNINVAPSLVLFTVSPASVQAKDNAQDAAIAELKAAVQALQAE